MPRTAVLPQQLLVGAAARLSMVPKKRPGIHRFSTALSAVPLYGACTRTMTFENVCAKGSTGRHISLIRRRDVETLAALASKDVLFRVPVGPAPPAEGARARKGVRPLCPKPVCVYLCVCVCVHTYTYTYTHNNIYTYNHIYILSLSVSLSVSVSVSLSHLLTHTHSHTHSLSLSLSLSLTHTHTHTHTNTHIRGASPVWRFPTPLRYTTRNLTIASTF